MADIRMLQEQTQQLQQQVVSAVEQLSATLKTINSRIDEQAGTTRKSFADQKLAVDQFGTATVSVHLHDNGGVANGGIDISPTPTFTSTAQLVSGRSSRAPSPIG